jgi:hypothetical protein
MARETASSPNENIVGKYPGPMSELVPSGYAREPIKNITEITKKVVPEYKSLRFLILNIGIYLISGCLLVIFLKNLRI